MSTKIFFIFISVVVSTTYWAQEKTNLSLENCISIAQKHSPLTKIAVLEFQSAKLDYKAFNSSLLPQISLRLVSPQFNRSISSIVLDDGRTSFLTQKEAFSSLNLQIQQQIPFTGGQIMLSSGLERIDIFGDINTSIWRSTPFRLEFRQPLFQYNAIKWADKLNNIKYKKAISEYHENMEGVAYDAVLKFFEFYLAKKNLEIAKSNFNVNDTIYYLSQGRYNVGKIAENELLQSEFELLSAKSNVSQAELAMKKTEKNLRIFLNLGESKEIDVLAVTQTPRYSLEPLELVEYAKKYRSDLLSFEQRKLEAERLVDIAKTNAGLNANLTASVGYNQSSEKFNYLYRDLLDQQYFNVTVEVPLYTWGSQTAKVDAATTRKDEVETEINWNKKEFENNVFFQAKEVEQLMEQLILASKADTIASRRFEVAKNRYLIGKIDITNLFLAQREKDQAKRSFIATQRQYWLAHYKLRQLTLYNFEEGKPIIN